MSEATKADRPLPVLSSEGLGPNATEFDKYAFLADMDITRSTCGGRTGRYASEATQRGYMVWADQQREIERLREELVDAQEALQRASCWLHAAYDRPLQTPECLSMMADVDALRGLGA